VNPKAAVVKGIRVHGVDDPPERGSAALAGVRSADSNAASGDEYS